MPEIVLETTQLATAPGKVTPTTSGVQGTQYEYALETTQLASAAGKVTPQRKTSAYTPSNSEASALIARMTTTPSDTRKSLIDSLIGSLKSAGVWPKFDCFYVLAAHATDAALLNWKGTNYNLTVNGGSTFTVDRGYVADGVGSDGLSSGFVPFTAAGLMSQDSSSVFVWANTGEQSAAAVIGNAVNFIRPRTTTDTFQSRLSEATTNTTGTLTDGSGLSHISRTASTGYAVYKNGASFGTVTSTSIAPVLNDSVMGICYAANIGSSTRQVAAGGWGSGLTSGEATSLYNALRTYLQGVGAAT